MFPSFNDHLDASNVGSILQNQLSLQLGPTSVFLTDVAVHLSSIVSQSQAISDSVAQGLLYLWDFCNTSISRSSSDTCFRDYARSNGTERDGNLFARFKVCAFLGQRFITTSPLLEADASLQNFSMSKSLKSRGWQLERAVINNPVPVKPLSGRNHIIIGDQNRAFLYSECSAMPCNDELWTFAPTTKGTSWKLLPVVPSPSLLSFSLSDVPSFQGPTLQYQDSRLFVIGGSMRSNSVFTHQGRFTVATFELNVDKTQAVMNLFLYHDFSAVVDSTSASNGTHAFIFGGKLGWGRTENCILVLSYSLMQVTKFLAAPDAPSDALFSGVSFSADLV
jgi:hypothetical protein